jgi:hypothetical protein
MQASAGITCRAIETTTDDVYDLYSMCVLSQFAFLPVGWPVPLLTDPNRTSGAYTARYFLNNPIILSILSALRG